MEELHGSVPMWMLYPPPLLQMMQHQHQQHKPATAQRSTALRQHNPYQHTAKEQNASTWQHQPFHEDHAHDCALTDTQDSLSDIEVSEEFVAFLRTSDENRRRRKQAEKESAERQLREQQEAEEEAERQAALAEETHYRKLLGNRYEEYMRRRQEMEIRYQGLPESKAPFWPLLPFNL